VALHQAQAMLNGAVVFQKTINFNTAGIAAGIKAMTFPAGLFLPSNPLVVSVVTAFNGTTPRLNFGWQQADATNAGSPFGDGGGVDGRDRQRGRDVRAEERECPDAEHREAGAARPVGRPR
jgi:hypothetical protein